MNERTHALSYQARNHYVDKLPYHDWSHAEDVMRIVGTIADMSIAPKVRANKDLLIIAAAWHDADYHLEDLGDFASKEYRSAELAKQMLTELSSEERSLVYAAIVDTTVDLHPKSGLLGEVLHAADIGYFADETDRFMERLRLMRREWGAPEWHVVVKRTQAFGLSAIDETHSLMHEILRTEDADAWFERIKTNLDYLDNELKSGRLSD